MTISSYPLQHLIPANSGAFCRRLIVGMALLIVGCAPFPKHSTSLIMGYEILNAPGEMSHYVVGSAWRVCQGEISGSILQTQNFDGLGDASMLDSEKGRDELAIPVKKWISSALHQKFKNIVITDMNGLGTISVAEPREISRPTLGEVAILSNFTFRVTGLSTIGSNPGLLLSNSYFRITGNREIEIHTFADGNVRIEMGDPVVLAVRIIDGNDTVQDIVREIDCSEKALGVWQPGPLGYRIELESSCNYEKRTASVRITDSDNSKLFEAKHVFTNSELWTTPTRLVHVQYGDFPRFNYSWDDISIRWNGDRAPTELEVARHQLTTRGIKWLP